MTGRTPNDKNLALQRQLDLLEQTGEVARIGAWEILLPGNDLYWSAVTRRIHEVPEDYVPDREHAVLFFKEGESRNKIEGYLQDAIEKGQRYDDEFLIITAKGDELWVRSTGIPEIVAGICVRIYGTFQDIQVQKLQEIRLANNELRYRAIIENSLYAFLQTMPGKLVLDANQAAVDMFGYTVEELRKLGRYDLLDRNDHRIEDFLARRDQEGKATAELTAIRKNGEHFPCQMSSAIYTDVNGEKVNSLVIVDLTESKRAEEKIREERKLLRTLIDHLPINVYIKDINSRKTMVNRSEINYMNGLTEAEILGKNDFELYPQATAETFRKEDRQVLDTGIPMISRETIDIKEDGTVNHLLTSKIPLKNNSNQIVGLLGISYDITNIKEAERALAVSEEKYRKIFENIQDIYYRTDIDGVVTEISPSIQKYYGYRREDVIGSLAIDFYYFKEDREKILKALKGGLAVTDFEVKLRSDKGELLYASVNARLIVEEGIIVGSEGSIRDITLRKLQENELTSLNTELKALNNHREQLLSVIGHDLRNPVAASLKLCELALMDPEEATKEELLEYLSKMKAGLSNANELLEDLLHWAQSRSNSLNFNPVFIKDVQQLILTGLERLTPMANAKGLILYDRIEPQLKIHADKDMLDTIIRNLVSNAIKFTSEGSVTVSAYVRSGDTLFSVSDTGSGISEETIHQLFTKSFNVTTYGTSGEKGTGLGLQLCRDFVEKHKGRIWVESSPGHGSTFYFTIPFKD